jgi:aldehyde:ferredoxin oxidoreductase
MLNAYYEARGWDQESGKPSKEKLIELGLEDVAKEIWE